MTLTFIVIAIAILLACAVGYYVLMSRPDLQEGDEAPEKIVTTISGGPITEETRAINPANGQQNDYLVLTEDERAKGYVRPVRKTYVHLKCGSTTTMARPLAETYARDPKFYSGTFCCKCRAHFPVEEFVWDGTNEKVGS
jgi:hypothetical protein